MRYPSYRWHLLSRAIHHKDTFACETRLDAYFKCSPTANFIVHGETLIQYLRNTSMQLEVVSKFHKLSSTIYKRSYGQYHWSWNFSKLVLKTHINVNTKSNTTLNQNQISLSLCILRYELLKRSLSQPDLFNYIMSTTSHLYQY